MKTNFKSFSKIPITVITFKYILYQTKTYFSERGGLIQNNKVLTH